MSAERGIKQGDNWNLQVRLSSEARAAAPAAAFIALLSVVGLIALPVIAAVTAKKYEAALKNFVETFAPKVRGPESPGLPSK